MDLSKYRMPHFDIKLGNTNQSILDIYKKYIVSINCEYVVNAPAIAQIAVKSYAYVEHLFIEGMRVRVFLGWDKNNMIKMIDGEIVTRPDGVTATETSYTITIQDRHSLSLSKKKKNRTFPVKYKTGIIDYVCALAKVPATISIMDDTIIEEEFAPIQKNETDAEFLFKCAQNWNCEIWFDENGLNFIDAEKAYDYGDLNRIKHFEDQLKVYELGYRVNLKKNNVAKIQWKKHDSKGGGPGNPGSEGANEKGKAKSIEDYKFEHWGQHWTWKPAIKKEMKNATGNKKSELTQKYYQLATEAKNSQAQSIIKRFFVPVAHNKKSLLGKGAGGSTKHGRGAGLELAIDLNIGDPFLRPPRNTTLECGVVGQEHTYLPSFIFKDSEAKQDFVISKVKTQLVNGMITTSMVATL